MARRSRSTDKGPLWRGYRRPVWRDGVFWLAFCTSLAGLLVQNAFGNFEATTSGWLIFGLEVVITFAIVYALIGVLAGTLRGFGEGWRQAEKAAPPRGPVETTTTAAPKATEPEPEPRAAAPRPEPTIAPPPAPARPTEAEREPAVATSSSSPAEPAPKESPPGPSDRPKAGVEMERHARRLGRAIGAGRRTYRKFDKD